MTALQRTILHADMDAFYAAVEQRDDPALRGKPVIVGGDKPRQVVATASYEARKFGVRSAMPGVRARQLCPQGVFVRPRPEIYAAVSAAVHEVFDRYTDLVEPLSLDEAFLDVTGSRALFGGGRIIAERIQREVLAATQLTVSVGVAANKFVAKVASDLKKPHGLVVVRPGEEADFLAPLSVGRLWGVGPVMQERLRACGFERIADLQHVGRAELQRRFGEQQTEHLWRLCQGVDDRPVEAGRQAQSVGHELTFDHDLQTREEAREVLLQLAAQVGRRLRRGGSRCRTIRLKLRLADFSTSTRQCRVSPTHDDSLLFESAVRLFDGAWQRGDRVRLLGVTAADLVTTNAPSQGSLFADPEVERRERLLRAMDAIRDRHGEQGVARGLGRHASTPWGPGLQD